MNSLQQYKESDIQQVDLSIMLAPEMVRVVRLAVSGIASTVGFQIDEIEDIKVAVAEICNRIIIQSNPIVQRCVIKFNISENGLKVTFEFEDHKPQNFKLFDDNDLFGLAIVNTLMDEVVLENGMNNKGIISLGMNLKESFV